MCKKFGSELSNNFLIIFPTFYYLVVDLWFQSQCLERYLFNQVQLDKTPQKTLQKTCLKSERKGTAQWIALPLDYCKSNFFRDQKITYYIAFKFDHVLFFNIFTLLDFVEYFCQLQQSSLNFKFCYLVSTWFYILKLFKNDPKPKHYFSIERYM